MNLHLLSLLSVPPYYYSNIDEHGNRRDRNERPELCNASVEYIAPSQFSVRPPQDPVFLFLIDVSSSAWSSGLAQASIESIRVALDFLPDGENTRVGIVAFDCQIYVFDLSVNATIFDFALLLALFVDSAFFSPSK